MKKVFQLKLEKCLCASVFKSLSILIVICQLSFVNCTDDADRTENITGVVGFHTTDVASSRAAVVGLPDLKLEGAGFRVSAYATGTEEWSVAKGNPNTKPEFMHNQAVTWTGNAWTYDPVKYWPGLVDGTNYGNVSFFAWNEIFNDPDIFRVSADNVAGPPTLTYTVPNALADQKDLVVAMATDKTVNTNNGAVALSFGHALSRIGFTAKLEDHYEDMKIAITSLKVRYATDKVQSKGVYTFGETDPWSFPEEADKVYMSHTGDGDEVRTGGDVMLTESSQPMNDADKYLMLLPQTVEAGDVTINVAWEFLDASGSSGSYDETIPLPKQIWLPGKCYNYSLTISKSGMTLDPVLIDPWGEPTLYRPCTITYNANGGTGDDIVEHRMTNVSYRVADQIFGRDLHRFLGWNTEPGGGGTTYRAGDNITCTGDLTLYAQWIIIDDGRTNCYMVKPGGAVAFRVSRAYEDEGQSNNTLRTGGEYTGDFEAAVLWDDNEVIDESALDVSGSGSNTVVTVTTNNKSGNAVVKIYKAGDGTATPVWSYHIWVTDPDAIVPWENTNQPGYIFMDRNLGATEAALSLAGRGLFYQWGRKDPFPGGKSGTAGYAVRNKFTGIDGEYKFVTGSDYAGSSSTAAQINASIQHPTVFFSQVTSGDWLSTKDDALWNVTSGSNRIKSIYDPCPSGWRVPEHVGNVGSTNNSPWTGLTSYAFTAGDNGGATFSASYMETLYPAAGYRYSGGSFDLGGNTGYNWSASVTGDNGYCLYISSSGTVGTNSSRYRAYGFSVRCVQDKPGP